MSVVAVAAVFLSGVLAAQPAGPFNGHADLSSYQENPTLSVAGAGTLDVTIGKDGESLSYTLSYDGITSNVLQSHIHLGRPGVNGGIMVFLCTNLAPPAGVPLPPACPQGFGTVSGVLTAADVIGPAGQGIAAGEFAEVVAALRAEAGYGNVHTAAFPAGAIRGQSHSLGTIR